MQISEFNGIIQYHDGLAVSDYTNMIPLQGSVIDRQGEQLVVTHNDAPLETFVDSDDNIYIAYSNGVYAWRCEQVGQEVQLVPINQPDGLLLEIPALCNKATFCESATKPAQVFFCDGQNVYYWNIKNVVSNPETVVEPYRSRVTAFTPQQIPIFTDVTAMRRIVAIQDPAQTGDSGTLYGFWPVINETNYDFTKLLAIESIAWFDNRLVCKEANTNTIYLTGIDPSRWIIPNPAIGLPQCLVSKIPNGYVNDFLPHYYSSTASSATLVDVCAFAGQLYLLNDFSIEIWSATGNDQNPIQHNSQATLYYGGRSPVIIANQMYLLCKDTIHNDFVASISQAGQFKHVSNIEIERQLQKGAYRIRPLSIRDQSMIAIYADNTYCVGYSCTNENKWWRVLNGKVTGNFAIWTIRNYHGTLINITNRGCISFNTDSHRSFCDGTPIPRWLRGAFIQCVGRKILREVELVCDTGKQLSPGLARPDFYLRVSFDRGLGFGPYLYRRFGAHGTNDRTIVWRNCGSGNSILLEFGTSADARFQIYGIRFELV